KRLLVSCGTVAIALACLAIGPGRAEARDDHRGISQSGEQKNMRRVGHVDLQGRPSYQPNVIVYPDGRTIAFAGTHGGSKQNPLNRSEEHTSELQSLTNLVCRLLLEKKKNKT